MNGLVLVGFEVIAVAFVDLTLKISIVTFVIVEKVSERVKIGEGSQYVDYFRVFADRGIIQIEIFRLGNIKVIL